MTMNQKNLGFNLQKLDSFLIFDDTDDRRDIKEPAKNFDPKVDPDKINENDHKDPRNQL